LQIFFQGHFPTHLDIEFSKYLSEHIFRDRMVFWTWANTHHTHTHSLLSHSLSYTHTHTHLHCRNSFETSALVKKCVDKINCSTDYICVEQFCHIKLFFEVKKDSYNQMRATKSLYKNIFNLLNKCIRSQNIFFLEIHKN